MCGSTWSLNIHLYFITILLFFDEHMPDPIQLIIAMMYMCMHVQCTCTCIDVHVYEDENTCTCMYVCLTHVLLSRYVF